MRDRLSSERDGLQPKWHSERVDPPASICAMSQEGAERSGVAARDGCTGHDAELLDERGLADSSAVEGLTHMLLLRLAGGDDGPRGS
jgi:hypothetical protein